MSPLCLWYPWLGWEARVVLGRFYGLKLLILLNSVGYLYSLERINSKAIFDLTFSVYDVLFCRRELRHREAFHALLLCCVQEFFVVGRP